MSHRRQNRTGNIFAETVSPLRRAATDPAAYRPSSSGWRASGSTPTPDEDEQLLLEAMFEQLRKEHRLVELATLEKAPIEDQIEYACLVAEVKGLEKQLAKCRPDDKGQIVIRGEINHAEYKRRQLLDHLDKLAQKHSTQTEQHSLARFRPTSRRQFAAPARSVS
ncbi:hypothetical protein JCM10212_006250 [Sporobolomyces blumeae]